MFANVSNTKPKLIKNEKRIHQKLIRIDSVLKSLATNLENEGEVLNFSKKVKKYNLIIENSFLSKTTEEKQDKFFPEASVAYHKTIPKKILLHQKTTSIDSIKMPKNSTLSTKEKKSDRNIENANGFAFFFVFFWCTALNKIENKIFQLPRAKIL